MNQNTGSPTLGIHVLANLKGCPSDLLESAETLKRILNEVISEADLNKVGETFHQFEPAGATGVIVLAESHLSAHTWPEHGTVAVDIFTCGKEGNAHEALDMLVKRFKPTAVEKKVVER